MILGIEITKNAFASDHNLKLYFKFSSNSSVYSPISTFVSSMLHAIFAQSEFQVVKRVLNKG